MKKYFLILILIFPSLCLSDWFVVRDGSADFSFKSPENDLSVAGYIVKIKRGLVGTYELHADIKSSDPLKFSYSYKEPGTIRIRIYSYNVKRMLSEGCLKGTVKLTSSKPPKELSIK